MSWFCILLFYYIHCFYKSDHACEVKCIHLYHLESLYFNWKCVWTSLRVIFLHGISLDLTSTVDTTGRFWNHKNNAPSLREGSSLYPKCCLTVGMAKRADCITGNAGLGQMGHFLVWTKRVWLDQNTCFNTLIIFNIFIMTITIISLELFEKKRCR